MDNRTREFAERVEKFFNSSPDEREAVYRRLRLQLHCDYSDLCAKSRNLSRAQKFHPERRGIDEMLTQHTDDWHEYDLGSTESYIYAILTGRYDACLDHITSHAYMVNNSNVELQNIVNDFCNRAARLRLEEAPEAVAIAREQQKVAEEKREAYERQLLDYPPKNWGTVKYPDEAERIAAWRAQPIITRARDSRRS